MLDHKVVSQMGRATLQPELTQVAASHRVTQVDIGNVLTTIRSIADVETTAHAAR